MFIRPTNNKAAAPQRRRALLEPVLFSMLATIMFLSDILMELLPNIHLVGMLCVTYTLVFRAKGLIPLYIYVMLNGIYAGFSMWWVPYLYIWLPLWAMAMLIPRRAPRWAMGIMCPLVSALHGFAFGTLYAPAQAIMFGLDFEATVAWIVAGLPFDLIHGVSNFASGFLIFPLSELMKRLLKGTYR